MKPSILRLHPPPLPPQYRQPRAQSPELTVFLLQFTTRYSLQIMCVILAKSLNLSVPQFHHL